MKDLLGSQKSLMQAIALPVIKVGVPVIVSITIAYTSALLLYDGSHEKINFRSEKLLLLYLVKGIFAVM